MQNQENGQKSVTAEIRCREDAVDGMVKKAAAECADQLRQMAGEKELLLRNTQKKLDQYRREQVAQAEQSMEEEIALVRVKAEKEAQLLREKALPNMDAAVSLITKTLLGTL